MNCSIKSLAYLTSIFFKSCHILIFFYTIFYISFISRFLTNVCHFGVYQALYIRSADINKTSLYHFDEPISVISQHYALRKRICKNSWQSLSIVFPYPLTKCVPHPRFGYHLIKHFVVKLGKVPANLPSLLLLSVDITIIGRFERIH